MPDEYTFGGKLKIIGVLIVVIIVVLAPLLLWSSYTDAQSAAEKRARTPPTPIPTATPPAFLDVPEGADVFRWQGMNCISLDGGLFCR